MAVYQIFASADATLYSQYPVKNTGRDPILEVSVDNNLEDLNRFLYRVGRTENPYYTYDLAGGTGAPAAAYQGYFANQSGSTYFAVVSGSTYYVTQEFNARRAVLQFSPADIQKLYTFASSSISGSWQANLKLFLASAQNLNTTYSLQAYPLTQPWSMGTGQYAQSPQSQNGVSWNYTGPSNGSPLWINPGGTWNANLTGSQFFDYMSNKDVNMNISGIMNAWFSGSTPNYGVIVKHPTNIENNTSSFIDLKFFSVDTHTIYPPTIEFKWDDSNYYPQGVNYVLSDQITIVLANNPGQFMQNEVYKVRLGTRYTYPERQFTTSSVYLTNLILSEDTYWAIQDVKTNEMVVDFDTNYTKLSCDSVGNYFTLYTSGLEINRFYRILIKTNILSTTYGPLSVYNNQQSIYNALSLYGTGSLSVLPAEEVIYSGQNLVFKIVG
jgi:hypothetical protein